MATRRAASIKKKTTTKKPKSNVETKRGVAAEHPSVVASSVPENVRLDPCTAQTEWLKQLAKDAPPPIFSTMALVNGSKMIVAKEVREGFSFNPQMDLLFAAGFPQVAIVMDGLPLEDTKESLLELYGREESETEGWRWVQLKLGRVYARRAAFGRIFECQTKKATTVLGLETEKAFLKATEPRKLSSKEMMNTFRFSEDIENDALILEALEGPESTIGAAISVLETKKKSQSSDYEILSSLQPIFQRLTKESARSFEERLRAWSETIGVEDSVASALKRLTGAGRTKRNLDEYCARFFSPSGLRDWDCLPDMNSAYVDTFSSIRSSEMLAGLLLVGSRKEARAMVSAWLRVHGPNLKDALNTLAAGADEQISSLATEALRSL